MTETITVRPAEAARSAGPPMVWGLNAGQLLDAFWRGQGVHVVRRGEGGYVDRSAELFLLAEPGELVVFDLAELIDRLVWRNPAVAYLRVVEQAAPIYTERIVAERGLVQRIERRYRPRSGQSTRVMLTRSRRICRIWISASNGSDGWRRIRRSVGWARLDHVRCPGWCFAQGDGTQERALIDWLVAHWPDPHRAIEGLEDLRPGVWKLAGDRVAKGAILVEPLWLGRGGLQDADACLIGPAWTADRAAAEGGNGRGARLRKISEVDPADEQNAAASPPRAGSVYAFAKRTFDIVGSLAALLALLPVFAVVAVWILLEDGRPVFYGHLRQARGGKPFRCWKFRTMSANAGKLTPELIEKNICDGPQVFIKHDPRVTRIGHILRRLQIDEFPQFWNVLIGQMSIVGPRPSPDEENQYCPSWRDLRLSVRPGITGLWQLERTRAPGRDFQEWIKYDIDYVRSASFWFDLTICFKTVWRLLLSKRP